jgi:hypothetical protein
VCGWRGAGRGCGDGVEGGTCEGDASKMETPSGKRLIGPADQTMRWTCLRGVGTCQNVSSSFFFLPLPFGAGARLTSFLVGRSKMAMQNVKCVVVGDGAGISKKKRGVRPSPRALSARRAVTSSARESAARSRVARGRSGLCGGVF